jgi:transcriptional regulator with XRE-family HTH domain
MKTENHSLRKPDESRYYSPLILELEQEIRTRGHTVLEFAERSGISYSYAASLVNGNRKTNHLSRDYLTKIANYLNIPTAQAFLLAEVMEPCDFALKKELLSADQKMAVAMQEHAKWKGFAPKKEEWELLSDNIKAFIVFLFEEASLTHIIERRVRVDGTECEIERRERNNEGELKKRIPLPMGSQ